MGGWGAGRAMVLVGYWPAGAPRLRCAWWQTPGGPVRRPPGSARALGGRPAPPADRAGRPHRRRGPARPTTGGTAARLSDPRRVESTRTAPGDWWHPRPI